MTTIVVTTLADQDDGTINSPVSGGTSLRDAINFANAAPGGGDTITFSPLLNGVIDLTDGPLPAITANMTIDGPGADILSIDGQGQSGILTISAGANVTFSGLTLTDGNSTDGGAIDNGGTLTVINCTLSNNQSHGGGAIFNALNSVLTMTGCTLFDNSTVVGGGICNLGAANLTDCTLSGNTAVIGGGIYSYTGTLALNNCTVAGNKAEQGGGLFVILSPNTTLNNTIVADSVSGGDIYSETGGEKLVGSNNLVGDGNDDFGLTNTITGNPKLGPLAWNGGPAQTMALLTGSPAIGKGAVLGVTIDQRGFALDSPEPDIGAFQYQGPPPSVTISAPSQGTVQVASTFTLTTEDPTPADQSGTFTYTIDWNGDGSDIETIQGPASFQVTHAYNAAGSYTPIVTVVDQNNRSSSAVAAGRRL